ncbi:hypothetical protein BT96DRAFT_1003656 [Gymnopus androsaceus JB14]|uniref:Uncharacterized protein n=1 Tax=Gymnopus androsaceus JB14 TaxID=1447944 RepID=A0A6A4GV85_9AGAR|nr:hypothetical protein BT96DRAFT_1003656 [Gymnopus androsaceus JB14]
MVWWPHCVPRSRSPTSIWRPVWDLIDISDFALGLWQLSKFFAAYIRRVPKPTAIKLPDPTFHKHLVYHLVAQTIFSRELAVDLLVVLVGTIRVVPVE